MNYKKGPPEKKNPTIRTSDEFPTKCTYVPRFLHAGGDSNKSIEPQISPKKEEKPITGCCSAAPQGKREDAKSSLQNETPFYLGDVLKRFAIGGATFGAFCGLVAAGQGAIGLGAGVLIGAAAGAIGGPLAFGFMYMLAAGSQGEL